MRRHGYRKEVNSAPPLDTHTDRVGDDRLVKQRCVAPVKPLDNHHWNNRRLDYVEVGFKRGNRLVLTWGVLASVGLDDG